MNDMMKKAAVVLVLLSSAGPVAGQERTVLARFEGAIGVDPVANAAGAPNADGTLPNVRLNVVRGVSPASRWTIAGLRADVYADGHIRVRGQGLLLANGNSIGQNANQRVFATLICEAAAPFVERSTSFAGVALEADGGFRIDDTLNPAPSECASPVLLIRASSNGTWFAAGIARLADDDR